MAGCQHTASGLLGSETAVLRKAPEHHPKHAPTLTLADTAAQRGGSAAHGHLQKQGHETF